MSPLPEPLVPQECDLTVFPNMPIEIRRLQRSAAWRAAKREPELGFYMLNLWMAAWHEWPSASLEDDDEALCDLAMCDPDRWPVVREKVLRGWVKCSDGRLYHPVVAEKALEVHENRRSKSTRSRAAAAARWQKYSINASALPEHSDSNADAMPTDAKEPKRAERAESNEQREPARMMPAGQAGSLADFEIPDDWIEEARQKREAAKQPPVNLHAEAAKALAKWQADPPRKRHAAWIGWALNARADLGNGASYAGPGPPSARHEHDAPTGPPPPLPQPRH